jgi:DNA-binding MarR family transcriptional regulator
VQLTLEDLPQLTCACASLRRAARSVTRLYERMIGMRVPQFTLLYLLDKRPLNQTIVAELLGLDRTTLTRTLGAMERRGLIRSREGDDKRERIWSLAAAGTRQLEIARPRWERAQAYLKKRLGQERWDVLLHELTNVAIAPTFGRRYKIRKMPAPRL